MPDEVRAHSPQERRIGERDLTAWPTAAGRGLARGALWLGGWAGEHVVLLVTALVGLLVAVGATVGAGEVYEGVLEGADLSRLDVPVLDAMVRLRSPGLDRAVTGLTDLGGTVGMPVIALVAVAVMTWRWRAWTPLVLTAVAAAGSVAMTVAGKDLVGRARPPLTLAVPPYETSPSFPSGHSLNAVVIVGVLVYLVLPHLHHKRTRTLLVVAGTVFAAAIGLSRVFLGHHWLTDVVAGWLLGLGWLAVVVTAHRLQLTARRHRATAEASAHAA
ncbi:phosphatase PAP2 family protein [Lapillicoccus jejuensis]|uniref:Undecaprenyl-diphosphatase n=1 Tax=Lapillicoccus jejuensis TaxID=402171 RepID=A0A542DX41_9MICO|nr:phosphatase PAP2 family protein [Lapillicoccus jejuensis]TQJ07657.1 undecaprenyl-diphosphatase [Lapillicoccus jejuensis]